MTTIINGSSPSITFSDSTTQNSAGLPATGGNITGNLNVSGNVGVGTTSPSYKLQLKQPSNTALGSLLGIQSSADDSSLALGYRSDTGGMVITATYGSTGSYQPIIFRTSDTNRMVLDTSGNLGVKSSGTTTPTYDFNTLGEGLFSRYWDNSGTRTADIVALGNTPAGATQVMRFLTNTGGSPGTAVERGRFDASGNFLFNSGYGSVATAYGCRAWVNFNGTGTIAIRGSGNVSSITDHAAGEYGINFTNALVDTNYASLAVAGGQEGGQSEIPRRSTSPTTSNVRVIYNNGNSDSLYMSVSIYR